MVTGPENFTRVKGIMGSMEHQAKITLSLTTLNVSHYWIIQQGNEA